jgi:myo-inositol-1(or 4)-monophosphatase
MMLIENQLIKTISVDRLWEFAACGQFIARKAGALLLRRSQQFVHWEKKQGDWVTEADIEAQRLIQTYLSHKFPEHGFLGEESLESDPNLPGSANPYPVELLWVVDPLDGTVNFIHQLRSYSVSIGLVARELTTGSEEVLVGVVYDPTTDELFSAIAGQGAWLNDRPLRVSDCRRVERALLVISTNTRLGRDNPQITRMLQAMGTSASVRRLGSAALNLSYVAAGRVDAYWASNLNSWDVAAGWLIAREAGASLESLDSRPLSLANPAFCCAATAELSRQLLDLFQDSAE